MLIFAHRGVHDRKMSENTLEAFARAVEMKADGIEFDVRVSRDGELVVIHDENLHRVAGDARRVRDLTKNELKDVLLRGRGSIPTLNDITSSVPPPMMFDIEIKDRDAIPPLIAKLQTSASLRDRAIVSSFVLDDLVQVSAGVPGIRTAILMRSWPLLFRGQALWRRLEEAKVWGVGFPVNILNARRMHVLRQRGWSVLSWDLQPLKREAKRLARLSPDVAIVFRVDSCH
ncbi:MAG: glycerophosphodiester phosphodiesterase family protein [Patescibacteria group bacterium]|jgi:glycerophosphoryl diester phosphodiesterase